MISWLWNIVVGHLCFHKYEIFKEVDVWERGRDLPIGFAFYMRCKKCGNLKIKRERG